MMLFQGFLKVIKYSPTCLFQKQVLYQLTIPDVLRPKDSITGEVRFVVCTARCTNVLRLNLALYSELARGIKTDLVNNISNT